MSVNLPDTAMSVKSALFPGYLDYMSLDAVIVKTRGGKRVSAYSSMYLDPLLRVYV